MVVNVDTIAERLKYLDTVLQELNKHRTTSQAEFSASLSEQWIVERGLIAAASIVFDITDHILAGEFGVYAPSYEDSLASLNTQGVISDSLFQQLQGLGGLQNILVHRYFQIDPAEIYDNFQKGLRIFPIFAQEIVTWLEAST